MTHQTGIPTTYKSRRYRSRLEARWANFFDLLGWRHEYEPFDADGYIPDFALIAPDGLVLVEIKPTAKFLPDVAERIRHATESFSPKGLLLLGCTVGGLSPRIGNFDGKIEDIVRSADLGWSYTPQFGWRIETVRADEAGVYDIILGGPPYDGTLTGRPFRDMLPAWTEIEPKWAEAGNRVQWRAA